MPGEHERDRHARDARVSRRERHGSGEVERGHQDQRERERVGEREGRRERGCRAEPGETARDDPARRAQPAPGAGAGDDGQNQDRYRDRRPERNPGSGRRERKQRRLREGAQRGEPGGGRRQRPRPSFAGDRGGQEAEPERVPCPRRQERVRERAGRVARADLRPRDRSAERRVPPGRGGERHGRAEDRDERELEPSRRLYGRDRAAELERRQRPPECEPEREPGERRGKAEEQQATVECPDAQDFDGTRCPPDAASSFSPLVYRMDQVAVPARSALRRSSSTSCWIRLRCARSTSLMSSWTALNSLLGAGSSAARCRSQRVVTTSRWSSLSWFMGRTLRPSPLSRKGKVVTMW